MEKRENGKGHKSDRYWLDLNTNYLDIVHKDLAKQD